eukprot:CAMPEP_0203877710 /NCGR_PEP_ID=MMETSP0359-20131031/22299_1 /ASSEMBLY_ACC=CAM_ASM_000338 /TAXON_ID=268821 /ORGANISM="Scrippsiella Hangoei, Strain SHTV-5" /LENGTH=813 /DNA_ID=CAMNT_0050796735 /DNA_START=84 /DNA_END=2522 /DNA_ORIENTATION=+
MDDRRVCGGCGSADSVDFVCGNCEAEFYCSSECQRAAWKSHKKQCRQSRGGVRLSKDASPSPNEADCATNEALTTNAPSVGSRVVAHFQLPDRTKSTNPLDATCEASAPGGITLLFDFGIRQVVPLSWICRPEDDVGCVPDRVQDPIHAPKPVRTCEEESTSCASMGAEVDSDTIFASKEDRQAKNVAVDYREQLSRSYMLKLGRAIDTRTKHRIRRESLSVPLRATENRKPKNDEHARTVHHDTESDSRLSRVAQDSPWRSSRSVENAFNESFDAFMGSQEQANSRDTTQVELSAQREKKLKSEKPLSIPRGASERRRARERRENLTQYKTSERSDSRGVERKLRESVNAFRGAASWRALAQDVADSSDHSTVGRHEDMHLDDTIGGHSLIENNAKKGETTSSQLNEMLVASHGEDLQAQFDLDPGPQSREAQQHNKCDSEHQSEVGLEGSDDCQHDFDLGCFAAASTPDDCEVVDEESDSEHQSEAGLEVAGGCLDNSDLGCVAPGGFPDHCDVVEALQTRCSEGEHDTDSLTGEMVEGRQEEYEEVEEKDNDDETEEEVGKDEPEEQRTASSPVLADVLTGQEDVEEQEDDQFEKQEGKLEADEHQQTSGQDAAGRESAGFWAEEDAEIVPDSLRVQQDSLPSAEIGSCRIAQSSAKVVESVTFAATTAPTGGVQKGPTIKVRRPEPESSSFSAAGRRLKEVLSARHRGTSLERAESEHACAKQRLRVFLQNRQQGLVTQVGGASSSTSQPTPSVEGKPDENEEDEEEEEEEEDAMVLRLRELRASIRGAASAAAVAPMPVVPEHGAAEM